MNLSILSNSTILAFGIKEKEELFELGFATKERGIDTSSEEENGDFEIFEYLNITKKNIQDIRSSHPFKKELAPRDECRKQSKEEFENFLCSENQIKYAKDMSSDDFELIQYSKGVQNPFSKKNSDIDKFVVVGDVAWNYRKFYLDGVYETAVGYRKDKILAFLDQLGLEMSFELQTKKEYEKELSEKNEIENEKKEKETQRLDNLCVFSKEESDKFIEKAKSSARGSREIVAKYAQLANSKEIFGDQEGIHTLEKHGYKIFLKYGRPHLKRGGRAKEIVGVGSMVYVPANAWVLDMPKFIKELTETLGGNND